jgi:hypothetical protein
MRTTITLRGQVAITYLKNGSVRIEHVKPCRPRLHVRGDEFLRLIHAAAKRPVVIGLPEADERSGIL